MKKSGTAQKVYRGLNDIKKCNLLRNLGGVRGLGDCSIGYSFVDIYIDKEKGIQGTLLE